MTTESHAAVAEADWKAFTERLRRYVGQRVPASQADDVTSDVLLKLVTQKEKLAQADNPVAWIYRVAQNAIVDTYRRNATEQRVIAADAPGDAAAADEPPAAEEPAAALSECILPFIRTLPPRYAEALTLTEIEGLTQRAAAARLGISVSGMKSRVQRGREKLKLAVIGCCDVSANARGDILDFQPRDRESRTVAACRGG